MGEFSDDQETHDRTGTQLGSKLLHIVQYQTSLPNNQKKHHNVTSNNSIMLFHLIRRLDFGTHGFRVGDRVKWVHEYEAMKTCKNTQKDCLW